jgi:2-hydroxychromene-2-carboxylate isomerase
MTARPLLEFWFEFASNYSYLTAMRIAALAEAAGVEVAWRPFLLGPIFAAQGWRSSPFNLFPAKGRYAIRDCEREAEALGVPFRMPVPFPQDGLLAARVAVAAERDWLPAFVRAVYAAEFGDGRSISEPAAIADILRGLGQDAHEIMTAALAPANKAALKAQTDEAAARGIFGAPTFFTPDGEMFWGNDRLERAIAWTAGERSRA